jgi:hypothetical protein
MNNAFDRGFELGFNDGAARHSFHCPSVSSDYYVQREYLSGYSKGFDAGINHGKKDTVPAQMFA